MNKINRRDPRWIQAREAAFAVIAKGENAKIRELKKRLEKENDPSEISALISAIDALSGYVTKGKEAREKRKKDKADKLKAAEPKPEAAAPAEPEAAAAPTTAVPIEAAPHHDDKERGKEPCSNCGEMCYELIDGKFCPNCEKLRQEHDAEGNEAAYFDEMGFDADQRVQYQREHTMCDVCQHPAERHNFMEGANYACNECDAHNAGGPCAKGYPPHMEDAAPTEVAGGSSQNDDGSWTRDEEHPDSPEAAPADDGGGQFDQEVLSRVVHDWANALPQEELDAILALPQNVDTEKSRDGLASAVFEECCKWSAWKAPAGSWDALKSYSEEFYKSCMDANE